MVRQIPNIITLGNLICGSLAVLEALNGDLRWASLYILLGAFLDFFDGLAARLLNVSNELGKQLDSLADLISFGLAPTFIAYRLMSESVVLWNVEENLATALIYLTFFIIAMSAMRLAKFNIDTRQTLDFMGMPTPANALFWLSIPLILHYEAGSYIATMFANPYTLAFFVIAMSILLVVEIPIFSLKFKSFGLQGNEWKIVLALISIILLVALSVQALPLIIIIYLLLSLIKNITNNARSNNS